MSNDDKSDLTRIEDLSEFLHEDDPETDRILEEQEEDEQELGDSDQEATFDNDQEEDFLSSDPPEFASEEEEIDIEAPAWDEEESVDFDDNSSETIFGNDFEDSSSEELETNFDEDDDVKKLHDSSEEFETAFGEDDEEADNTFSTENQFEELPETSDNIDDESSEEPISPPSLDEKPVSQPTSASYQQEKFQDVKDFAKNFSYGPVESGGNPPYSVILKGITYKEDAEDILIILREHGLVTSDNETLMKQSLDNGSLLISQISEYSAIYLAHRMRRFKVDILLGLSEELHPSKSYQNEQKGLVSKEHVHQNKKSSLVLQKPLLELEDVLTSSTPTLEGYYIRDYLSVATEHAIVEDQKLEDSDEELQELYKNLAEKLKLQALKHSGNAVVGINYQLTPLISSENSSKARYKVTCTGNIVWLEGERE